MRYLCYTPSESENHATYILLCVCVCACLHVDFPGVSNCLSFLLVERKIMPIHHITSSLLIILLSEWHLYHEFSFWRFFFFWCYFLGILDYCVLYFYSTLNTGRLWLYSLHFYISSSIFWISRIPFLDFDQVCLFQYVLK